MEEISVLSQKKGLQKKKWGGLSPFENSLPFHWQS